MLIDGAWEGVVAGDFIEVEVTGEPVTVEARLPLRPSAPTGVPPEPAPPPWRRLPLELQVVLELYFWEEMTAADIGRVIDKPEGTVRTRVRRAKQLLEEILPTLAASPQELKSTTSGLDDWAASLRNVVQPPAGRAPIRPGYPAHRQIDDQIAAIR